MAKTRESLIGAETSKKHLEDRVEDLIRQIKGNEEKISVYERRTTAPGTTTDTGASTELNLESEVAELKSSLKRTQLELKSAREHVEQFKQISQTSETALADLNATMTEAEARHTAQVARFEVLLTYSFWLVS